MSNSEKQIIKSRFIAFAALLQAAIESGYKFPFSKTLKETGLFEVNNGCKCMKKILVDEQKLIVLDVYDIPRFTVGKQSEGLHRDAIKLADRLILYTNDYVARYLENRKTKLAAKKAKLSQYVYHWTVGKKPQFAIVNAESKADADVIFAEEYGDSENYAFAGSKKLNNTQNIIHVNNLFL